jgi:hypothetical protein
VALALGLSVLAAAPFLARPGLPRGTDAELHVYRAAELGYSLRAGALYPRWAPSLYLGYGYPIFNYYAPLTYYLANLFDLALPGVDIVGGVKAVFVLGICLGSLGTYLLGRELFGPAGGGMAAASFILAPYIVLIDPHARGDLAEHFAVCLLPMAFYAFRRLVSGVGGRGALLGSVLTVAALVCSHNLIALVGAALLFGYWIWELAFGARHGRRSRLGRGILAFGTAAALTAFFWLPALLEWGAVELTVTGPGHFDFREHFVSPGELLAPSRALDLGATAPRYRNNLGLAQWLLAVPALAILLRRGRVHQLLFFPLGGLVLVFLMLSISTPVWDLVPGMAYLQFPWRLLGPANLMLAVCAGATATLLPTGRWRNPALAVWIAFILVMALPVLYPPMWAPDFGSTAPKDIIIWELQTGALGTTSTGDFVPKGAALVPLQPRASLIESHAGPGPVDKVNRAALPEGTLVDIISHGPLHDDFDVSTSKKFVLRLYTFYFPGWRAYVDGKRTEIEVASPEGFITVWVPEGEHEVSVRFEDTPPRTMGWAIAAVGALMLAVTVALKRGNDCCCQQSATGDHGSMIWLVGAVVLFAGLKSWVIDPHDDWMRYTSPPGEAWAATYKRTADFGGQIRFLGYDLPRWRVRSGDTFPVTLYWHAPTPVDVNYQSFVHLARPIHTLWGQMDHLNPGDLPTTRWPQDKYVWDEYELRVLPGTPPGKYLLNVGLYSLAGGYRLPWLSDADGQPVGDSLVIASIDVESARRQPSPGDLGLTHAVSATFPGGVTLLGYSQPALKVRLPDPWYITLYWRADRDRPTVRTRDFVLVDRSGAEVWRGSGVPAEYPFANWTAGEIVRDPIAFVPTESMNLEIGWHDFGVVIGAEGHPAPGQEGELWTRLGEVKFKAPRSE